MPRGKAERYLVVFGWYVEGTSQEDARLKAKRNLAHEEERSPVDFYRITETPKDSLRDKDADI